MWPNLKRNWQSISPMKNLPPDLVEKAAADQVILFVGAGTSKALGLPTYPELMREIGTLLDFDGDLYGEYMAFEFVARLRPTLRFDSVEALVTQVALDVEATRTATSPT